MRIKEARAELDKAIEFYGDCVKDGDTLEEKCHAEEIVDDAINTLMLAVLDEAQRIAWATFMLEVDFTIKPNPAWDALRTRIQEPVRAERS